jgi:hypothetical protein
MTKTPKDHYLIETPEGWEIESNESSDAIFDPNGKGALTISSYTKTDGHSDSREALEKFIAGKGTIESRNENGQFFAESAYTDENKYIYASAISKGNILVLASYNCQKDNISDSEIDLVKKIISRIEIR